MKTKEKPESPEPENEELEHFQIESDPEKTEFTGGIFKVNEIDVEQRTVTAIISSDIVDRDSEVLIPKGIRLENFEKNPVVLWSHNAGLPSIGKALWVKVGRKRILAKVRFAMTDRAEEVWQLFKQGFLKAFSVGFLPIKGHRPMPDEIKKNPALAEARFLHIEWELLEFSPVTVPANPEALSQAVKNKTIKLSAGLQKCLKVVAIEEKQEDEVIQVCIPVKEITPEVKIIKVLPLTAEGKPYT